MTCPHCSALIELDEDDLDEGDLVSCDECGTDLTVASTNPVELELAAEDDEEEEDEEFEDEDEADEEDDEFEEDDEEEADEWS